MTPVEEPIDHEEAKRIAERMERWSIVECAKLACAYLDLLTEHSAREEREKEIKLGRALIDHLQGQVTWEKTEHDKARDEWLTMRDRLNSLHRAITGALEHTKPPESWVGNAAAYEGGIEAEPYGWLATLVAEAQADYPAFLDYDEAATAALPATEPAQPEERGVDLTLRCPTCGRRADMCFEHGDDWKKRPDPTQGWRFTPPGFTRPGAQPEQDHLIETTAREFERKGNAALANGLTYEAKRWFVVADAIRKQPPIAQPEEPHAQE